MKHTDWLSILFGNLATVKLLRLFLFNPSAVFSVDDILRRARLVRHTARAELSSLERALIIQKKQIQVLGPNGKKRRVQGYALNHKFPKLAPLQTFLFETAPLESKTVFRHMRKAGKLDLVVTSGIFTRSFDGRLDLILAAKKVQQGKIEAAVRTLEAELGIEIRFAVFSTEDFLYRLGMYDKLTRDVFDYPHQILVDKIGTRDALRK
ncbi:hypothetical protein K2X96_02050 [Patescibacteria group bacterium]|nr:hypothetical protein [Patescibacteria group bacterium]